jgi:hypothetical protein
MNGLYCRNNLHLRSYIPTTYIERFAPSTVRAQEQEHFMTSGCRILCRNNRGVCEVRPIYSEFFIDEP